MRAVSLNPVTNANQHGPAPARPHGVQRRENAAPSNNPRANVPPVMVRHAMRATPEAVAALYRETFRDHRLTHADAYASDVLGLTMDGCGRVRRGATNTSAEVLHRMIGEAVYVRLIPFERVLEILYGPVRRMHVEAGE